MSRQEIQIDEKQVYKLARIGCTNCEIADIVGCDETTVRKRFAEILTKGRATLKTRLRRVQLQMALSGKHPIMMIWVAKNVLGWSDRPEVEQVKTVPTELKIVRPDLAKIGS